MIDHIGSPVKGFTMFRFTLNGMILSFCETALLLFGPGLALYLVAMLSRQSGSSLIPAVGLSLGILFLALAWAALLFFLIDRENRILAEIGDTRRRAPHSSGRLPY